MSLDCTTYTLLIYDPYNGPESLGVCDSCKQQLRGCGYGIGWRGFDYCPYCGKRFIEKTFEEDYDDNKTVYGLQILSENG